MAKNYTISEAVEIIAKGKDLESIADLGRRYPVLLQKVTKVAAKAGDDFVDFMKFMPDYLSANKVNTTIKNMINGSEDTEKEETVEEKVEEKKVEKKKKAEPVDEGDDAVDYNKFNGDTLIKMCKERGIYERGMKKAALVKAMEDYDVNGGAEQSDEEVEENPYEGKTAVELFKECKKRGIKAAPKKPAKFYIDLLVKDDEAVKEAVADEDDDWGDEEEVEETPKKPVKKSKPKKEEKVDEDDDDDWDI